jgi:hypothetical protein
MKTPENLRSAFPNLASRCLRGSNPAAPVTWTNVPDA